MGAVCTNMVVQEDDATRRSDNIDKVNKEENKKNSKELKILLLGTGEAGKSTIMKQTQIIYDKGFADDFKMDVKPIIYKQVVKNMKVLIRESGKYGDGPIDMECANRINQVEERILDPLEFENQFSPQVWEDLESLWKNPAIKKTYENGYKFTLDDSTGYFLEKLSVLKNRDYIPDNNDLLRSRTKTTAIVDRTFESGDNKFRILDVGGQRSERRKWAHCFSEVNALIFVVAISEYDQCLREDNSTRRLDESLKVYEDTINNKYFKDKVIILCFNKMDIFEKKIKERNLNLYYPEYKGTTKAEAIAFIQSKFDALDKNKANRNITHHTVATNSDLFKLVFDAVVDQVLRDSLRAAGFLRTKPNN